MKTLTVIASLALTAPLALMAQSTSGSSGRGTSEPGPSAAEASGFGNTGRSPSVTGSTDAAPRGTGSIPIKATGSEAAPTFHGSAVTADALFRTLDTNGDGQLNREEFAKIQSVMGTEGPTGGSNTGAGSGNRTTSPSGAGSNAAPTGAQK